MSSLVVLGGGFQAGSLTQMGSGPREQQAQWGWQELV